MLKRELMHLFEVEDVVDREDYPKGRQLDLLVQLATGYQARGLLDVVQPRPMWDCCAHGRECWKPRRLIPRRSSKVNCGQITLPWVGPLYEPGGVAVLAINLHNASGWLTEFEITCSSAGCPDHPSQIGSFEAGRRRAHRSPFAYGSTRTAAMLLDLADQEPIRDRSAPLDLIGPLNRIARLQAVKCAPADGGRGTPTRAMNRNCPPMLLADELAILKPALILTIGAAPSRAIRALPGFEPNPGGRSVLLGRLADKNTKTLVYSVAHPVAHAAWSRDHEALKRHLRRRACS